MPIDTEQRHLRREAIRAILESEAIASQAELVEALEARGIFATQSSVSRDLQDLGAAKVRGAYRVLDSLPSLAPPDDGLAAVASLLRQVAPAGPYLTVLHTAVGAAQSVAVVIDQSSWPEVVGTVAGDDTLFIATAGRRQQRQVVARLRLWISGATS